MSTIESRIADLGITLAEPPKPIASYVGFVKHNGMVFVSGQIPLVDGMIMQTGLLGDSVTLEEGQAAARICAINILAQMKLACDGDIERVAQCIRLGGYVAATPDFGDHPQVINGASDLMMDVLGDRGKHSRAAVGMASLPRNVSVEVDAIFAIKE
ncbi:MAG: RidA family protein [Pseudomonadota bacterium]